ncbi:matrixin family metalloprotease [Arthrobacter halodurans]|uniref:Matrixin family metalloprotease n=1 Tax=Arthrobacter halodurans TaxID=516699 RepID=A0ABV4UPN1_9MICC
MPHGGGEGYDPVGARDIRAARRARKRRMRTGRRRGAPRTALAIAFVAFLVFGPQLIERYLVPAVEPYLPGADVPPRGVDAAERPLGSPPAAGDSTSYRLFPAPDDGQEFLAYDPCRPVHYVVRPDHAPPGSDALVREAVAEVAAATGLRFVDDGATDEAPSDDRELYQPDRYGKKWAPVLIAWSTPEHNPELAGDIAGMGGSSYTSTAGSPWVFVAGQVELDAPDLADLMDHPLGREHVRAIIMHELGHVVGLDHVDDPTQLMHADANNVTRFGDGDLAGLARLGAGACVPEL